MSSEEKFGQIFEDLLRKKTIEYDAIVSMALQKYFSDADLFGNYRLIAEVANEMLRILEDYPNIKDQNLANKACLITKIKIQNRMKDMWEKISE